MCIVDPIITLYKLTMQLLTKTGRQPLDERVNNARLSQTRLKALTRPERVRTDSNDESHLQANSIIDTACAQPEFGTQGLSGSSITANVNHSHYILEAFVAHVPPEKRATMFGPGYGMLKQGWSYRITGITD